MWFLDLVRHRARQSCDPPADFDHDFWEIHVLTWVCGCALGCCYTMIDQEMGVMLMKCLVGGEFCLSNYLGMCLFIIQEVRREACSLKEHDMR